MIFFLNSGKYQLFAPKHKHYKRQQAKILMMYAFVNSAHLGYLIFIRIRITPINSTARKPYGKGRMHDNVRHEGIIVLCLIV